MAWLLSACNNERDTSTIDHELKGNRRYSQLDGHTLEQHEKKITRLKQELQEEQERSEQLTRSNDALSTQIQSLQKQLTSYANNAPQNQQTQHLLNEKESKLIQIQANYHESQKKVTELQHELDQWKQTQQTFDDLQHKYSAMEKQRDALLLQVNGNSSGEEYQAQFKAKDDTIARLKDEQTELEEKLNHETRRADAIQQSLNTKLAEMTRLEEEVERLRSKVQSKYQVMVTTEHGLSSDALLQMADEDGDNEYETDEEYEDEKGEFNQLKYLSTGPTVIGMDPDMFDAVECAMNVNKALDTLKSNPKERIQAAVNIVITCNAQQRKAIADQEAGNTVTLESKFRLYSSNKNVLKLLDDMMKSQSECDAQWLNTAISSKDESVVIEILFTRTNAQIEAFTQTYAQLYDKELHKDIEAAFMKKDKAFVKMCNSLIVLDKRPELSRSQVNKKWAKNDAKVLKEALIDDGNNDKTWKTLYDLVVNRSLSHLDQVERAFNHETKIRLTHQLKKANPSRNIARRAVMVVLEAAHSMHELFASYLYQALKKKKDDALHRVLLSRSEIDLADVDCEFTNNEQFGDSKTTRLWIENSTQSSLYRYILLSLLGLHDHDTERMESIRDRVLVRAPTKINIATPQMYRGALVKYNPSIVASNVFDAAKDANDIATWIKAGDSKGLKEKLAVLLPTRDATQRGQILAEYPKIMDDMAKVIKKGQVVTLADGLLKPSIAAYDAGIIEKCLDENDVTTIGDILCTKNNTEIETMIDAYKQTHYKAADLMQKVADLCEKNKSGSVRIILDSLLRCKRSEKKKEKVDMKAVASDVEFLINTKKFKAAEKERFVLMFCQNNWKYIRAINRQFGMKSSMNLEKLIKDKLGAAEGPGYFTLILLKYSCDPAGYFATKLFELGNKFDKNKEEIARVFLTRSEIDLNGIRARFAKTPYGKQLDAWLKDKAKDSRFGLFLSNILTSIDQYNAVLDARDDYKQMETMDSANGIISDNDSVLQVDKSTDSNTKYEDDSVQHEILSNETRKAQSLALLSSANGGLIKFVQKHLKSKIVTKMFAKLDPEKKGFIQMSSFPDLIAFLAILYKVKVHQQKTKTKTKPKLDNKAVRGEVEHLALWIAKTHVYDADNEFKLTQDEFQNKFGLWCQDYLQNKGVVAATD
eukprot:166319_1